MTLTRSASSVSPTAELSAIRREVEAARPMFVRVLGQNPERLIVFGSRARGEGGAWSDLDLAIIVRSLPADPIAAQWTIMNEWAREKRLPFLDAWVIAADQLDQDHPFFRALDREGVELSDLTA